MRLFQSIVLLLVFALLMYFFWDFDMAWYWKFVFCYIIISILFGFFILLKHSENDKFKPMVFWFGFAWPVKMVTGFMSVKSDHDRTMGDH